MTKKEFINALAEQTGATKTQVEAIIGAYHKTIIESLKKDEPVTFVGFGTYSSRVRLEREAFKPGTKEKMTVPAKKVGKFKMSKSVEL